MTPGLWLDGAEDIGCPAALVFVILARLPTWHCRLHVGVQGDRLFIEKDYWLLRIISPLNWLGKEESLTPGCAAYFNGMIRRASRWFRCPPGWWLAGVGRFNFRLA